MLTDDKIKNNTFWVRKIKWEMPKEGYKLNIDRSGIENLGEGGTSRVFRNCRGKWVLGYMINLYFTTNIKAELIAHL